ncbi:hypothetical protein ACFWXA_17565 [Streptomyces atroolivaceus]|uniref:hypothetical protein n=1 Tax=Streptomyces atroolivaceus TaxID=66869 RepID=UPI00366330CE
MSERSGHVGKINVSSRDLGRLLADSAGDPARSYQEAFAELADTAGESRSRRSCRCRAGPRMKLLESTVADLREQPEAIRSSARCTSRATSTTGR